jgi:hypothetical protein
MNIASTAAKSGAEVRPFDMCPAHETKAESEVEVPTNVF